GGRGALRRAQLPGLAEAIPGIGCHEPDPQSPAGDGCEPRRIKIRYAKTSRGGMGEWLKPAVLKTVCGVTRTGVRIPLPPPCFSYKSQRIQGLSEWRAFVPERPFREHIEAHNGGRSPITVAQTVATSTRSY